MQDRINKINNIFRKIQIEYADCGYEKTKYICDLKIYNIKKEAEKLLNFLLDNKYNTLKR